MLPRAAELRLNACCDATARVCACLLDSCWCCAFSNQNILVGKLSGLNYGYEDVLG